MAEAHKFSMVDAGQLARAATPVRRSPARDEILLGAALLWCRNLTTRTVRAIAMAVGRAPVTVVTPFGSMRRLYAQVIHDEWSLLDRRWYGAVPDAAWSFLDDHVAELSTIDRALMRLPAMVHAAVSSAASGTSPGYDVRTTVLYVVAAHATSPAPLDALLADLRHLERHVLAAA